MKSIGEIAMIELINEATIQDIQAKYYPDIDIEVIQRLNELSPDYNPSQPDRKTNYLPWFLKLYKNGDSIIKFILNGTWNCTTLKKSLVKFEQIKNELPQNERDINKYDITDMLSFYEKYGNYLSQKDKRKVIKNETDVLYDTADWRIVSPKTFEASKFWGLNTKWCTAWNDNRKYYDNYTLQGPLFINIDKRNNKKWQFHFESNSFYNSEDESIIKIILKDDSNGSSIAQFCKLPEEVLNWYKQNVKGWEILIKEHPNAIEKHIFFQKNGIYFMDESEEYFGDYYDQDENWETVSYLIYMFDTKSNEEKCLGEFDECEFGFDKYLNCVLLYDDYKKLMILFDDDLSYKLIDLSYSDDYYYYKGNANIMYNIDDFNNIIIDNGDADNNIPIISIEKYGNTINNIKSLEDGILNFEFDSGKVVKFDINKKKFIEDSMEESKYKFWNTLNRLNEIKKRDSNNNIL